MASIDEHEKGQVKITWLVYETGKIADVKVTTSSSFARLDKAALDAAKKCEFRPYIVDGIKTRAKYSRWYTFRIAP